MLKYRVVVTIGWLWVGVASLVLVLGIVGAFIANGFWGGIAQIQEWFSPTNVANLIVLVITFGPGLALISWGAKLKPEERTTIHPT